MSRGALQRVLVCLVPLLPWLAGCEQEPAPKPAPAAPALPKPAEARRVPLGRNVWLEVEGKHRRVVFDSVVCLREGQLEQLLCRRHTKEHEAILAADVDARDLHKGLLLTGAEPGSPASYQPRYEPAKGPRVRVTLRYEDKGKTVTVPAQSWVRNALTHKALDTDWVFVGSQFQQDPLDPTRPPLYAANGGDVICVSNFEDALLDLPIKSPKDNAELVFEAYTERIPPLETKVSVLLEPFAEDVKAGK
jgi:hypothetical protein